MDGVIKMVDIASHMNEVGWDFLQLLSKKEYVTYEDFMKNFGICRQKCKEEIARLDGCLLVSSVADPRNRRELQFRITENGLELLRLR